MGRGESEGTAFDEAANQPPENRGSAQARTKARGTRGAELAHDAGTKNDGSISQLNRVGALKVRKPSSGWSGRLTELTC